MFAAVFEASYAITWEHFFTILSVGLLYQTVSTFGKYGHHSQIKVHHHAQSEEIPSRLQRYGSGQTHG